MTVEYARPDRDIYTLGIDVINPQSSPATAWSRINDETPDDGTSFVRLGSTFFDFLEVGLSPTNQPPQYFPVILNMRYQVTEDSLHVWAILKCCGINVFSRPLEFKHPWSTVQIYLTQEEIDSITDWSDISFGALNVGGGGEIAFTQVFLQVGAPIWSSSG